MIKLKQPGSSLSLFAAHDLPWVLFVKIPNPIVAKCVPPRWRCDAGRRAPAACLANSESESAKNSAVSEDYRHVGEGLACNRLAREVGGAVGRVGESPGSLRVATCL